MTADRPPARRRRLRAITASAMLVAGLTGCGTHTSPQSITVLAAASLKPTFTELGDVFRAEHPGVSVYFDFASSPDLATQLSHGATGDVFASADTAQMDKVAATGLTAEHPVNFATNTLVIVTAPGNPKRIASFADLAEPGLAVVISPPPMPCGVATERVEAHTGIHLNPVSAEPDVEDVLNKVVTGQADAGLVNATDALVAGDKVTTVRFPEAADALSTYPIVLLKIADQPDLAAEFIKLVTGERGRQILGRAGFDAP